MGGGQADRRRTERKGRQVGLGSFKDSAHFQISGSPVGIGVVKINQKGTAEKIRESGRKGQRQFQPAVRVKQAVQIGLSPLIEAADKNRIVETDVHIGL